MKKLVYLLALWLIGGTSGFAQTKDYPKLVNLFSQGKYEACIENALKISNKEQREIKPVLYCAKSYYELYKISGPADKLANLKNALKYAGKLEKLDKKSELKDGYFGLLDTLHTATLDYALELYNGPQKEKSKPVFESLARIFKDTTAHYYEFFPPEVKKSISSVGVNTTKDKINQTDSKGLKQGFWSKAYSNGSLAYEVNFKDNVPVGDYKRYHENGKLSIYFKYDDIGEWADAQVFDENGKLIGQGKYHRKVKDGQWFYYKNGVKLIEENYKEGKREGISKAFFDNGQVLDERNFTKDKENGVWRQYYPSGKKRLETRVDNGVRNSVYYVYYDNGGLEIRGKYTNDHMDGDWIYYDKKGKELRKIKYVMGKTDQRDKLDAEDAKIFQEMEKNKGRFLDPKDYINNPYEYMQNKGMKQE